MSISNNTRESKGNSIIDFPLDFVVVDIETTGLSPQYDSIIEIAAVKYKDGFEVDQFQTLVKPTTVIVNKDEEGNEIFLYVDEFITNLTGITNDMLENAPLFNEIAKDFINFIGSNTIVGYNVNFDINFLYDNLLEAENYLLSNNFIDVMRISRKLFPEFKHHRLKDMVEYYQINHVHVHRALGDCKATNECYLKLKNEAENKWGSPEEFCKNAFKSNNRSNKKINIKEIIGDKSKNNPDSPLYGKNCVFTGKLQKFLRKDAMQIVADLGGSNQNTVTKKTNFLIIGDTNYCSNMKGDKSSKQIKAEEYKLLGQDIEIISETTFYEMISEI